MSIEQRIDEQNKALQEEIAEDIKKKKDKEDAEIARKNHPKFKEMRDIANNEELHQAFKKLSLSFPEITDSDCRYFSLFGRIKFSGIAKYGDNDTDCEGFGGSSDKMVEVEIKYSEKLGEITIFYKNVPMRSQLESTDVNKILDQMARDIILTKQERELEKELEKIREKEDGDRRESERIASRPERLERYKDKLLFKEERYKKRFLISMFAPMFGWNKANIITELTEKEVQDLKDIKNGRDLVDFK